MRGIGTTVNVLAVVAGGSIGMLLRGRLPIRIRRLIPQFVGLVALFLGARSLLEGWFSDGELGVEVTGTMLVILALLIGGLCGEALRLDRFLDKLGWALGRLTRQDPPSDTGKKSPASKKQPTILADPTDAALGLRTGSRFADGFVISTVLCAFSAMSFSGTIQEGLGGGSKELFIKAAIDAVLVLALASVYGLGAVFGAAPLLLVQSEMSAISYLWGDKMTPTLIAHLTIIAAVITMGMGINLSFGKRWRVVNLLPALLISPLYGLIMQVFDKISD